MRAARACLVAAALAAVIAPAIPARAGTSAADRDAARNLAGKGYEALEAGQHQRALELFQQAEARFHAPTHWLYIARAQIKLGRLVEARASLERVTTEKLAPDAPAPFKEAQASARTELGELTANIPSLTVVIDGEAPPGTRITIDGEPLSPDDLGKPSHRDPGSHVVTAEPPGKPAIERTVELRAGSGETRVALPFPKRSPYIVPAAISFSLGAVGIGVGVTTAILAMNAKDPTRGQLRIGEITGFAVGGAALVTGIVLVAIPTRPAATAAVPLQVGIGPGSLTVGGQF